MSKGYFKAPTPLFNVIPAELRQLVQWVVWKLVLRKGDWTKVPYNARSGKAASSTDPTTWSTFDEAVDAYNKPNRKAYDGIGVALKPPHVGADIDACRDPVTGDLSPEAEAIVRSFDSYTEVSPSGTGVKIFARGSLPFDGRKKGDIEIYRASRYFTVTGHHLPGSPTEIRNAQPAIDHLLATVFGSNTTGQAASPAPTRGTSPAAAALDPTLQAIVDGAMRATNGAKFRALYEGDWSAYPSQSEADCALCGILAFWTHNDPVKIDAIFRTTGLMDSKWDEQRGSMTYGQRTIAYVCGAASPIGVARGASGHPAGPLGVSSSPPPLPTVPPFPVDVFPHPIREFVEQVAGALPCPSDLVAVPFLSVLGTAIGGGREVEIKAGWREAPRIWSCVIALPGTKKSPALDYAVAPLKRIQLRLAHEHTAAMRTYRDERDRWEIAHRAWIIAVKKDPATAGPRPDEPAEPSLQQVFTTDATMEAFGVLLDQNPRGLLFLRDELTAWVRSMNQYRGGKGADRQHWMSFWNGATVLINRKGGPPLQIPKPFVSVTGCLPPELLSELADKQQREDGFVHRILFSYPEQPPAGWSDAVVDVNVVESTCRLVVDRIFTENVYGGVPAVVTLTQDAHGRFRDWQSRHFAEMQSHDFSHSLRGPWRKIEAYCARLSLIIHEVRWAAGESVDRDKIDTESMEAAILLTEYFKGHAPRVYTEVVKSATDRRIDAALAWIGRQPQKTTTARDLLHARVAGIATSAEADQLLVELEARGFGTVTPGPRRSKTFIMN